MVWGDGQFALQLGMCGERCPSRHEFCGGHDRGEASSHYPHTHKTTTMDHALARRWWMTPTPFPLGQEICVNHITCHAMVIGCRSNFGRAWKLPTSILAQLFALLNPPSQPWTSTKPKMPCCGMRMLRAHNSNECLDPQYSSATYVPVTRMIRLDPLSS